MSDEELESERAFWRGSYRFGLGLFGSLVPTSLIGSLIGWQALPTDSPGLSILYVWASAFVSIVACTGHNARVAREKYEKKKSLDKD